MVMVNDFLGNLIDGDEHLFVVVHGSAKVVVFDVEAEPFGTRGGKGAVDDDFESCHVSHLHT